MKKFQRVVSILLVIIVLAIPTMSVFAKEGMLMTIRGPGIKGEMTLNQSDLLMSLEDSGFFGFSGNISAIKPLDNPGDGYNITAAIIENGKPVPFVEMVYYPAEEGQAGYVHYVSRINGKALAPVDEWGQLPLHADKAFRRLMTANKITLQPAVLAAPAAVAVEQAQSQPEVQPATSSSAVTSPAQAPFGMMAIIAAILVLAVLGAGLILRKRVVSQRSV